MRFELQRGKVGMMEGGVLCEAAGHSTGVLTPGRSANIVEVMQPNTLRKGAKGPRSCIRLRLKGNQLL